MDKIVAKREVKRATIDDICLRVENLLSAEAEAKAPSTLRKLHAELSAHQESLVSFDSKIDASLTLTDPEAFKKEIVQVDEYISKIANAFGTLETLAQKHESPASSDDEDDPPRTPRGTTPHYHLRLPQIDIPTFNGDILQWSAFWDQFNSMIGLNLSISKTEKMLLLKQKLAGSAALQIAGLQIKEGNYDAAIKLLQDRYGDKDVIKTRHMQQLIDLAPVKDSTNLPALRRLVQQVETNIQGLIVAGVELKSYGGLLFPVLLRAVPSDIALSFRQLHKTTDCEVLLTFLRDQVSDREHCELALQPNRSERTASNNPGRHQHQRGRPQRKPPRPSYQPSASALTAGSSHHQSYNQLSFKPYCVFCKGSHYPADCTKSMTVNERKDILDKSNRCLKCTRPRHNAKFCRRSDIKCTRCNADNHLSILCQRGTAGSGNSIPSQSSAISATSATTQAMHAPTSQTHIALQTATVIANGDGRQMMLRALIDGGSHCSFITESAANELKLKTVKRTATTIYSFMQTQSNEKTYRVVRLTLNSRFNENAINVELICVPTICVDTTREIDDDLVCRFVDMGHSIADLPSADRKSNGFSILLGSDYYWGILTGRIERINERLVASETIFGWTFQGPLCTSGQMQNYSCHLVSVLQNEIQESCLGEFDPASFWKLESLGIMANEQENSDESATFERFCKGVIVNDDSRYEVPLLQKQNHTAIGNLADNRQIASSRLSSLLRKLRNDPATLEKYREIFDSYLRDGIIEVAPSDSHGRYYMPHRAVVREDKATTKMRVVFDASSKSSGNSSLNDTLECGPNLNPDSLDVLLRFRTFPIGVVSDIRAAFLQISVRPSDRDYLRFLWSDDPCAGPSDFVAYRMARVPFGTTLSPFLLKATIMHHVEPYAKQFPHEVELIKKQLYVDDMIFGANDESSAIQTSQRVSNILLDAKMHLRKWHSNSVNVETTMTAQQSPEDAAQGSEKQVKVLGLTWNRADDELSVDTSIPIGATVVGFPTKRQVLQTIARVYDPLGFLSPYLITAKVIFQELWKQNSEWDEPIPELLRPQWTKWIIQLQALKLQVPRHIGTADPNCEELHVFCDASQKAYAACIYLVRRDLETNVITSNLMIAKARVAPLKPETLTIPRLELMAAVIASRLWAHVSKVLNKALETTLWSDSQIVLSWIASEPDTLKQFVSNRIQEVQRSTHGHAWRYCPTKQNPADLPTRGVSGSALLNCPLWFEGPPWLKLPRTEWPQIQYTEEAVPAELKTKVTVATNLSQVSNDQVPTLIEWQRYSSLNRVVRVIGYVRRFIHNCRNRNKKHLGPLAPEEIIAANSKCVLLAQSEMFSRERKQLLTSQQVPKSSDLHKLRPFIGDGGLLRLEGRLHLSQLDEVAKHPIILAPKHSFTHLLVMNAHCRLQHAGVRDTLNELREYYWITKGRSCVTQVLHQCVLCRRYKVRPGALPDAPLPADRLKQDHPFTITGVDFAGPLFVRSTAQQKAYIALFTCANTRALHLELVSELSTPAFMLALRRFISRRGMPEKMYSDNAKTFIRAEQDIKILFDLFKSQECQAMLGDRHIEWKFIVQRGAWWGGWWEKMVGLVKHHLKRTLGRACLPFEELATILTEIEATLNSRPLTGLTENADEPEALTPAHFLIGQRLTALPHSAKSTLEPSSRTTLAKRWRYRQRLGNLFWSRWNKDYLTSLRTLHQHKWTAEKPIRKDELVLIQDHSKPRQIWPVARVEEVYPGRDGKARSCLLRLPGAKMLKRPIQLIYPLEL